MLVDDVATTGATLSSCAEALYAAGARDVFALTVARAQRSMSRDVQHLTSMPDAIGDVPEEVL
jgi:phosphoribosylpyrophosphate synthetase